MDMLNEKMIMTGLNVVKHGKLKELDKEDGGTVNRGSAGKMAIKMECVCMYDS